MRSKRIPAEEQYRLIMECRQSGLTDRQWDVEHDIKPGTFYNWVKRVLGIKKPRILAGIEQILQNRYAH